VSSRGYPAPDAPPPPPSRGASSSDYLIFQWAPEDARIALERQRNLQNRAVQKLTTAGRNNRAPVNAIVAYGGGCQAFTKELHRMAWPTKFCPELPRFDGTANPIEFLQVYTVGIQAVGGDDKVMANWFPMALRKQPTRG
jgi:hypothetical protein